MKYGVRAKWLSRRAQGQWGPENVTENVTEEAAENTTLEMASAEVEETGTSAVPEGQEETAEDMAEDTDVSQPLPTADETQDGEWEREAALVSQQYAGFDLAAERQDPRFLGMLQAGVPMLDAYRALHMEAILSDWSEQVRSEAEKRITDHVQARGVRPSENGAVRSGGLQLWQNVHQLTREKRAEIADRARNGESISFR